MERLLGKTNSLNQLVQVFGRINLNQTRAYNVSRYVTKKKRIDANRISDSNKKWTKTLFEGMEDVKKIDLSEKHMLHVVTKEGDLRGVPWWERNIIWELGLFSIKNKKKTVILKNIAGINRMLDEVKHLITIKPLKLPLGLPQHEEEFKTIVLKSNGELVFQKYLECQVEGEQGKSEGEAKVDGEKTPVKEGPKNLGSEWIFQKLTLQLHLNRQVQLYKVNFEQFPSNYNYTRNQDGKMHRYTFNKNTRKHAL